MKDDATYYSELQAGAEYLADTASDAVERAVHLKMVHIYRRHALDAACSASGATFH